MPVVNSGFVCPRNETAAASDDTHWLSVLARGIPCDTRNPACVQSSSTQWNANRDLVKRAKRDKSQGQPTLFVHLDYTWQGTVRERRSLHFFITVSASILSGFFDSDFWRRLLPQATYSDNATKHAVAAIGAIHEYQLRKQADRENGETSGLSSFALRQCNKAIGGLMRPVRNMERDDLVRILTASILFACFESMNGDRKAAVPHVLYARRIVELSKNHSCENGHQNSFPVTLETVEPITIHYEAQLGDAWDDKAPDGHVHNFTIEDPVSIDSVIDARVSLTRAVTSLSMVIYTLVEHHEPEEIAIVAAKKAIHRAWFERWDVALTGYLARTCRTMDSHDLAGCRVLKLHQVAAFIFSSVRYGAGEEQWAEYSLQWRIIVELGADIMEQSLPRRAVASPPPQTPHINPTMGLTEPLYMTAARCADPAIAARARELLSRLPHYEGAYSSWRIDFLEYNLCVASGKVYSQSQSTTSEASSQTVEQVQ